MKTIPLLWPELSLHFGIAHSEITLKHFATLLTAGATVITEHAAWKVEEIRVDDNKVEFVGPTDRYHVLHRTGGTDQNVSVMFSQPAGCNYRVPQDPNRNDAA